MGSVFEMYFKEFLRKRRKAMGLTQEELAKRVLVSKSAITKWESGRGIPDRTNLRQLSKVLGVSIDKLNSVCEGKETAVTNEEILNDIINVLRSYGYTVTKGEEN